MSDLELRALSAYVERDTALMNAAITRYGELQQAPDYAAAGRLRTELEARGVLTPETAPWAAVEAQEDIAALTQERDEARSQASALSSAKAEVINQQAARITALEQALEEIAEYDPPSAEYDPPILVCRRIARAALAAAPQGDTSCS